MTAKRARIRCRPRKPNHAGTVYYDASRDRYRGEIELGGRRQKVRGKTEDAVRRKLSDLRKTFYKEGRLPEAGRLTVEQYLTDWHKTVVQKRRRRSTHSQYESPIRVWALPRFGKRRLVDLRPRDLEAFYNDLEAGTATPQYKKKADGTRWPSRPLVNGGLSPKSIRNLHTGLHAAFERAVRHGLLTRNPADAVELPALSKPKKLPIDLEALQQLLAHAEAEYYGRGRRPGKGGNNVPPDAYPHAPA
jgi:integrase